MGQRHRLFLENLHDRVRTGAPAKWFRSGNHLVNDDAYAPDVTARIRRFRLRLLRRHVVDGAHDQTRRGLELTDDLSGTWAALLLSHFRETKVEHFHDMI